MAGMYSCVRKTKFHLAPSFLILVIKSDRRWAPSAEVTADNEVESEGMSEEDEEVVDFSGANYEGLWSKLVLDQRFSAKRGSLCL